MVRLRDKRASKASDSDDEEKGLTSTQRFPTAPRGPTALWRAAWAVVIRGFFGNPATRKRAIALLIGVLIALTVESGVLLRFSEVQKGYMTALQGKDAENFHEGLWKVVWLILFVIPVIGCHTFLQMALEIEWRAAITRNMAQLYLAGSGVGARGAFYRLYMDGSLDNPDQRICQDVGDLVSDSLGLLVDVLGSLMRLIGFLGVLYRVSPFVCAGLLVYAAASTLGAVLGFGPRIFKYQNAITQQEATLRYCLIRVRENAESVAFFKGGASEWANFQQFFLRLVETIYLRIWQITGFVMFNGAVRFSTFAVPVLLVGPRYMRGEAEFGEISQTQFAFQMIFEALMLITKKVPDLSNMAVRLSRLHALHEVLQQEASAKHPPSRPLGTPTAATAMNVLSSVGGSIALREDVEDGDPILEVAGMTLLTPPRAGSEQQTVIRGLQFALRAGESLLIVGESGIGKSSLLRAVAGLWSDGCGDVRRCGGSSIFFMPQRPYMCLGTLREQLLYPNLHASNVSLDEMLEALREVRLEYLPERHGFDNVKDWAGILSLGEQQRVNFARVLLQPGLRLALLDEGTSACDPDAEGRLYGALQRKVSSYVSVGHRPNLRRYHTHALLLHRDAVEGRGSSAAQTHEGACNVPAVGSYLSMAAFENLGLPS